MQGSDSCVLRWRCFLMDKKAVWIIFASFILLCSACSTPPNPIVPTIPIETTVPIGRTSTHVPLPLSTFTATPTPTITPIPSAYAPADATAAPPEATVQFRPANQNALVPNSISLSLSPAQWLGGSYYRLSGPTRASVFAPGAVARVEFFTAPTGTGATPTLEFVDSNGYDGWSWYWQTPRGGSHLWAEAVYANGKRASSQVLLILTNPPPSPTPTCETHTASVQVQPSLQSVQIGQQLIVRVTLLNQGCATLGVPQYTLRVHAPQGQPLFNPPVPDSVTHNLAIAPGQADSVDFVLQAAQVGSGSLQANVSFEVHIGLPGPAYKAETYSAPVNIAVTSGGTVPPPTPPCETHTASVQVQPSAQNVQVGQQLIVQVTLLNQGCVALGLPKYTLRVHAPQGQPLFNPPQPESVTHGLAVPPGQSDSVEFVLQGTQIGSGYLQADVSFEVHLGYPGPAYSGDATSAPVNIAVTGNLKPPDAEQPASGICDLANGDVVTININADVPYPRCMKVLSNQRLQVVNATNGPVQVQLAQFDVQLQPDQAQLFDATVGSYLAPGVHWLRVTGGNGPEIWLTSN
jgi:hypothetical protein